MAFSQYTDFDALGLAGLVQRKEVSPNELLEAAVAQVNTFDADINAVVLGLESLARKQIEGGLSAGPFSGVPFLLKDNGIELKGTATSSGSRFHDPQPATNNSHLTDIYLKAGLVIFGKTNTPEFAISGSTESKALGKCKNPWDLTKGSGGSSGGAAASVAMGYAPMAHGSDGGGSIRNPSSACGVFGFKPSRGRVVCGPDANESIGGMSVDHAITHSVRDSAAMLDVTSVLADEACTNKEPNVSFLDELNHPVRLLKIAFHVDAHHDVDIDPTCRKAAHLAAKLCEDLGHTVEEARPDIDGNAGLEIGSLLWKVNAAQNVASTTQALGQKPKYGELEWITQLLALEGSSVSAVDYLDALTAMHGFGQKLTAFFNHYDVVLSPVVSRPPWPLNVYENSYSDTQTYFETVNAYSPFCWPYNMSGQPAMSVPLHWTESGLPVGVQFAGRPGEDKTLLQLARQLEVAAPWFNRRPQILGTGNR
jgi:amidase